MSGPHGAATQERLILVGSSAGPDRTGAVTAHRWSAHAGLGKPLAQLELESPSWLAWSASGDLVYAVCEREAGCVTTVRVERDGPDDLTLTRIAEVPSGGGIPCHIAVLPAQSQLIVSNYASGSVSWLGLDTEGVATHIRARVDHVGSGPHPWRQTSAHPHQAVHDPQNGVTSVVDLGMDQIRSYQETDGAVRLVAVSALPPGTGPRQLVRDPDTRRAWVVGELSGSLIALEEVDPGAFNVVAAQQLSEHDEPNAPAQLVLDPGRQLLYVSNRGPDTIVTMDVSDVRPQRVGEVATGAHPRHFTLIARSLLVGGVEDDTVHIHRLDSAGLPGPGTRTDSRSPACIAPRPRSAPVESRA